MLTTRLFNVPPPADDAHLLELLHSVCKGFAADRVFKRIALLGDDGRTYRMIIAEGNHEFASLLDALSTLRFGPSTALVGVDAVLQRPTEAGA